MSGLRTIHTMAVALAKVPEKAVVAWNILLLVLRTEGEILRPELERIMQELKVLHEETVAVIKNAEELQAKLDPILEKALEVKKETEPLWEDNYNLCGNPRCAGDCTICLEGEEDYEDDYEEKYCRRGRR